MVAGRKPSTALAWFPLTPAAESQIIDMADARQIALRTRLRNLYWLTDGRPIGVDTVAQQRKKMLAISKKDTMTDDQVGELLSPHFGFVPSGDAWIIPDLDQAREAALGAVKAIRDRASAGGKAKAAKVASASGLNTVNDDNPEDF